ncbi:MAG: restriction endonuclease subunit S [Candidatus Giovannonibacteria bacterium]|nr:restriction endonuclease subunit S [Candidatus Giovannonibacteria bacterium]
MTYPTKKLGEVIKLQGGFAFKSSEYDISGIPLIRIQNLKNEVIDLNKIVFIDEKKKKDFEKFLLNDEDILVAMSGATTGKLARISSKQLPAFLNQRVGRFVVKDETKIDKEFLWYFLKFLRDSILKSAYGGAQPNVSPSKIENIKIPLPPIGEQRKIVAKLEKLLGKIKEAKKLRAEAQEAAQNLLPAELHRIFTQQHSNILENVRMSGKQEWEEKELGEVFVFHYGKGLSRSERSESGKYIVYGANGELGRSDKYLIDGEGIIVGRKGSAGEITRATGRYWPTDVTYFITEDKKYDIGFTYYLFKFLNFPQYAVGVKPGINRKEIYGIKIPLPPIAEQKKIVARMDSLSEKIHQLQEHQKSTGADLKNLEQSILSTSFKQ